MACQGLVTAGGSASAEGAAQEYEWETVHEGVTNEAALNTGAKEIAGAEPALASDLPIGQQSGAEIQSFMSKLPPKVSACHV